MPNEAKNVDAADGIGNLVLYQMCARWPKHDDAMHVSDKILVIGRVYAAAPSRGMADQALAGFNQSLADQLVSHSKVIDGELKKLRKSRFPACFDDVISLHQTVEEILVNFSADWQSGAGKERKVLSRPSFVSKYLHFHAPDAFPILDKYSELGAKSLQVFPRTRGLTRYARFCAAFATLMERTEFSDRSLRSIDKKLVALGRAA